MLAFPLHPRYARMLLAAQDYRCVYQACLLAALTQGRDLLLRNVDGDTVAAARGSAGRKGRQRFLAADAGLAACLRQRLPARSLPPAGRACRHRPAGRPALAAVPRNSPGARVWTPPNARSPTRRCRSASCSASATGWPGGWTPARCVASWCMAAAARWPGKASSSTARCWSPPKSAKWKARTRASRPLLSLATAIEEAWLRELFPEDIAAVPRVFYDADTKRVYAEEQLRFPRPGHRRAPSRAAPG